MTTALWKRYACCVAFAFATLLFLTIPAAAQQTLGSINGTVLDPAGASVAGATVTVTNSQIDVTRTTQSQGNGFFQFFNLPIGTYKVSVTRDGFDTTTQSGINIQEARTSTVNVSLKIGNKAETVEVTSNPLLNATDATNGYTLDAAQINETPLPTGSFTVLAALSPGVNSELGSGIGTNSGLGNAPIWANGQRDTSNTFQVNGVDATNLFNGKTSSSASSQRYNFNIGSSASGGVGQAAGGLVATGGSVYGSNGNGLPAPPPEFTQELRVNTSGYDAQQGATSGAQIDVATRSGTNSWHGGAYGTRATNAFNAVPFFFRQFYLLNAPNVPSSFANPELHRWTSGGTVGGPIIKDKLFFFGAYQHLYDSDQSTGLSFLRSPEFLTDDRSTGTLESATDFNNTSMDPIAIALLQATTPQGGYLIPTPQFTTTTSDEPNVILPGTSLLKADQANGALDYNVSQTDRLSAKYYYQHDPFVGPHAVSHTDGFPTLEDAGSHVFALDNTISLGSRLNWEQRLGFFREKVYSSYNQTFAGCNGDPTCGINFPGSTSFPGITLKKFGATSTNDYSTLAVGPASSFVNAGYFQNRLNPSTNVIFAIGKHTIVAGGGYSYTQLNIRNLRSFKGQLATSSRANFGKGAVSTASMIDSIGSDGRNYADRYYRTNEFNGYVQDKFQVMPNLSLTAGVRYDYHGGMTEKYGDIFNFDPSQYALGVTGTDADVKYDVTSTGFIVASNNKAFPTKGVTDSTLTGRQWGISPRIGFAWAPKQNHGKVVFNGGAGLYYDRGELFSYLSEPAGGSIGGPFGVSEAPPLVNLYSVNNGGTHFAAPLGSQAVTPPSGNPADFLALLNNQVQTMVSGCDAINNQANYLGCTSPFAFGAYDRANKLPYTINYTFKMQWQPTGDIAITLGYSGNRGRHAVVPVPFNQPGIATSSAPINGQTASYGYQVLNTASVGDAYGDFNAISTEPWDTFDGGNVDFRSPYIGYSPNSALFKAAGNSSYDGLESHLEKRFTHNFSAGISYTWSHTLDEQSDIGLFFTGNNPNNLHDSWASADFDRTNVFTANFRAMLPNVAKPNSILSYVTNGWNLTGLGTVQSGEPFSLYEFYGAVGSIYFGNYPTLSNPILPIKNSNNPRRALTGNNGAFRGSGGSYMPAIDPSYIQIPYLQPGEKGIPTCHSNEPCDYYETDFTKGQRNIFRQARQKRIDLSMRKSFNFRDHYALQYEFNVYNVTNTSSFDVPMNQAEIGQSDVLDPVVGYENYGQVAAAPGQNVSDQLYVLPTVTGSGKSTQVTGSQIGSVLGTIGSPRLITMGAHFTF
jgi:hypothetical protein